MREALSTESGDGMRHDRGRTRPPWSSALPAALLLVAGWAVTVAAAFVPIGWAPPFGVLVFVSAGALGVLTSIAAAVVAVAGHVRARRTGTVPSLAWTLSLVGAAAATLGAERLVAVLGIVLGYAIG